MLFIFKATYSVSLIKLTLALIWLLDYVSKCDSVALVVIKEIVPSKNTFNCFEKHFLGKITSVDIAKNNYQK